MTEDDKAFARAVEEMSGRVPRFEFSLGPLTVLAMISCLQMSHRHPGMSESMRRMLRKFIDDLLAMIERQSPTVADFMRRGDDPKFDVRI